MLGERRIQEALSVLNYLTYMGLGLGVGGLQPDIKALMERGQVVVLGLIHTALSSVGLMEQVLRLFFALVLVVFHLYLAVLTVP